MSEDLLGKVVKIAEFIEYQKGSVVSKELVGKKAGTVTLCLYGREDHHACRKKTGHSMRRKLAQTVLPFKLEEGERR